jgi:hypothetical protein
MMFKSSLALRGPAGRLIGRKALGGDLHASFVSITARQADLTEP